MVSSEQSPPGKQPRVELEEVESSVEKRSARSSQRVETGTTGTTTIGNTMAKATQPEDASVTMRQASSRSATASGQLPLSANVVAGVAQKGGQVDTVLPIGPDAPKSVRAALLAIMGKY